MPDQQQINSGSFVPTTNIWDIGQIYQIDTNSSSFKELIVRLYQNVNAISMVLNTKTSGYFVLQQFVTGELYFPNPALTSSTAATPVYRPNNRIEVIFGALPAAGTKSVAHGLNVGANYTWTNVSATATDPNGLTGINIPYASPTLANNIEINVDATNVNITVGINRSNYTITNVTLEYLLI